jgi:D-alanyl-D-alanine carboxypeptidase
VTTPLHAPLSTRKAVQLIAEAHALGVPANHGTSRNLKRVREATSLTFIGADTQGRPQWLTPRAARAWTHMRDAAASNDVMLEIVSAFRSIEYQLGIIRRKVERGLSMDEILRVSAAPAYSEHHSGRALDLTTPNYTPLEEDFENSPAFAWLSTNAKLYGFTMSYPRGNPHGIAYEPWHWCWHAKS